jgi:hypothetical protein
VAKLPSFTKYYWAAWLAACGIFALSVLVVSPSTGLGWFALLSGLGSICVFHFELGRLIGFLKTHCPDRYAELPNTHTFEIFAFFHPALLRSFWPHENSPFSAYTSAILVYRSAWFFTLFAVSFLLLLASVLR